MALLKSITRTLANTVGLVPSIIKDVATLGGHLTKQDKPYTLKTGQKLVDSVLDLDKDLQELGNKETDRPLR